MIVGVVLAALAAACAFVISLGSYQGQFMDTRTPMRLALRSALTAFVFFLAAAAVIPWVFRTFVVAR